MDVISWKLVTDRLALRSPKNFGSDVMAVCNTRLAPPGPGEVDSITATRSDEGCPLQS